MYYKYTTKIIKCTRNYTTKNKSTHSYTTKIAKNTHSCTESTKNTHNCTEKTRGIRKHIALSTNTDKKDIRAPSLRPMMYMVSRESTMVSARSNHVSCVFVIGLSVSLPHAYFLYADQACWNAPTTARCRSLVGPVASIVY